MKSILKEEKKLTGKRIDTNWMKYKIYRNPKYLRKLNELITKLVIIDSEIERRKGIAVNWQNDKGPQENNTGYRTTEKRQSETTKYNQTGYSFSTQVAEGTWILLGRNHNIGIVQPAQSAEKGRAAPPLTDGLNPNIPKVPQFNSHGPYQNQ